MSNALSPDDLRSLLEVCGQVAAKQRKLLAASRLSKDDVAQECLTTCLSRRASFDPAKGKWRSWCWRTANSRCIDLYRANKTQEKHFPRCEFVQNLPEPVSAAENRSLAMVAASALEAAEAVWPRYARRGPHRFTKPQLAALIAVRHHLRLSYAAVRMALAASQELQQVLGIARLPAIRTIHAAERSLCDVRSAKPAHRPRCLREPRRPAHVLPGPATHG